MIKITNKINSKTEIELPDVPFATVDRNSNIYFYYKERGVELEYLILGSRTDISPRKCTIKTLENVLKEGNEILINLELIVTPL